MSRISRPTIQETIWSVEVSETFALATFLPSRITCTVSAISKISFSRWEM